MTFPGAPPIGSTADHARLRNVDRDDAHPQYSLSSHEHESGTGGVPTGAVSPFAGSSAPDGWLVCDGSAVSRTAYGDLFATVGTTYGTGDGSTTFNLPNLSNRFPLGDGSRNPGDTGGAETHTLTTAELPSHNHSHFHSASIGNVKYNNTGTHGHHSQPGFAAEAPSDAVGVGASVPVNVTTDATNTGSGSAHNNMPPFLVLKWIIKT